MKLTGVAPVLLVRDVVASAAYWREKVGFAAELYGHPQRFAMLKRDGLVLMLQQAPAGHVITPNWRVVDKIWDAYFWVDDAKALHEELVGRGVAIDYGPYVAPHGCLEFGIQDLDDHDIAFGQILDRV